jgi:hypothetical protein
MGDMARGIIARYCKTDPCEFCGGSNFGSSV